MKILNALTRENPTIDNSSSNTGSNTLGPGDFELTGWTLWRDFNYKKLKARFERELAIEYLGSSPPRSLLDDLRQLCNAPRKLTSPGVGPCCARSAAPSRPQCPPL